MGIFRRTADFLDETCVDVATVSMVVPMPGTPTFRRLNADGRILTTDWSKYDGKKHCVFEPARMSPRELEAGTEWVARRFYSTRSIVARLAGSRAECGGIFPGTSATCSPVFGTPGHPGIRQNPELAAEHVNNGSV